MASKSHQTVIKEILAEIIKGNFSYSDHGSLRSLERAMSVSEIGYIAKHIKSARHMLKRDYKGLMNLKYVNVKNVPVKKDKEFGYLISADIMKQIEKKVAIEILLHSVPISGQEVEFFRNVLGMSQREFAKFFDLSQIAILKWEKGKSKRLSLINEIAFRTIMAKQLNLFVQSKRLVSHLDKAPKQLNVDFEVNYEELIDAA